MKKTIVIVTNWLRRGGGAERVTVIMANVLLGLGYAVKLVVQEETENEMASLVDDGVEIIYLQKHYSSIWSLILLSKFIMSHSGAVYIAANHRIALVLVLIRRLFGMRFRLLARNISNLSVLMADKFFFNRILKFGYRFVDLVIAQSLDMKKDLIENYHFKENQVHVIYNPIQKTSLQQKSSVNSRTEWRFLYVGRIRPEKGFNFLLAAMDILNRRGQNFFLTILGEGPLRDHFQEEVAKKSLTNRVKFEGFKENVSDYFNQNDLLLLTSLYEGFPNVLLQANAGGLPVVSFDTPFGPSEIIIPGVNGYLCKYLDVDDLVEKIEFTMHTDWSREKIAQTVDRFSLDNFVSALVNLVESPPNSGGTE
ncbi:MAG: glycosyltransferase [Candidatus Ozemobacteraceae bacterium]